MTSKGYKNRGIPIYEELLCGHIPSKLPFLDILKKYIPDGKQEE